MPLRAEAAQAVPEEAFIQVFSEASYTNAEGQQVIDLLEGDYAYISIQVETIDGQPLAGVEPALRLEGSSRIQSLMPPGVAEQTDDTGGYEFAVVGGKMGLDTLRISANGAVMQVQLNVISLESAGFAQPSSVADGFPWAELLGAQVEYREDGSVRAELRPKVQEADGSTITLAGFMMPLDPEAKQRHFLLTSSPPSCFFHIPGGPAGAVEVFAPKGVKASWDLLVLEGRLEALEQSEDGVVYRLHEAKPAKN